MCVDPNYFQSDVELSLRTVLGSGTLPDGQPAFFAPGRFVLGQTVYLSPIYRVARSVAGVLTVTAEEFQPQGTNTKAYLHRGAIPIGPDSGRADGQRPQPARSRSADPRAARREVTP